MSKARTINKRHAKKKAAKAVEGQIMASGFGSKEFSKAYDECASGELADAYRSYQYDCDGHIASTIIKERSEHFRKFLRSDEVARKILNGPVVDALANWRNSNYAWEDELGVPIVVQNAAKFARRFGCSVILPILKNADGRIIPANRPLENILDEGPITVDKLIYSKENLTIEGEIETDFYKPWYGFPKKIKFGDRQVHPSRVAFFGDIFDPFFMSIQGDLADYHEARRRLAIAVRRNTGIILTSDFGKISAFLQAKREVGSSAPTLQEITTERARSLYENINDVNAAVINIGEKVDFYQQTNIAELISNVETHMQILAGAASMPLSKLFSKVQSAGLNNGNSQTEFLNYGQDLDSWRIDFINPGLSQLDVIMSSVTRTEETEWEWNETKAEELWVRINQPEPTVVEGVAE